jgi:hypothetical protein
MNVQEEIKAMCDKVAELLIEKNRKYGNSALEPLRIFSKADLLETIRVRMDDKLCRIKNEQADEDEDVYMDLMGYLVLYMIARKQQNRKDWFRVVPRGEHGTHLEAAKRETLEQRVSDAASQLHAEKAKREALLAERGYKLDGYVVINSVGKRLERHELSCIVDCMGDAEQELKDALTYYLEQYPKQPSELKAPTCLVATSGIDKEYDKEVVDLLTELMLPDLEAALKQSKDSCDMALYDMIKKELDRRDLEKKAQRVTYAQAKKGLRDDTITLIADNAKQLAENSYGGDLSDALRTAKASSVAGIDKMSQESLDCLLCQAAEFGDYNLMHEVQDELARRGQIRKKPDNGCGFDEASVVPTT